MPLLSFTPEKEFLNRIRNNDRTVLGELFLRYERMVRSYVTGNGGDQADAEDMLQEAIIVLWQNVCSGKFELTSRLSTYLLGVVKNKWRAEQRKRSRLESDADLGDYEDGNPSALDGVLSDEQRQRVRTALNALSEICRELLTLFYFEERSMAEIARLLGFANADVAKAKKYQCKKALATLLKEPAPEAERRS